MSDNIMQHTLTKVMLERFVRNDKVRVVVKETGAVHDSSPKTELGSSNMDIAKEDR